MKLVESILTKNPCYTAGRKITVSGLMLHSVGCSQPNASVFINSWNSASHDSSCVHGFIDGNNGTVYQTLPWNHRGWHCGSGINGSANNTHIGVEMCEPACIKYIGGSTFTCSDTATAKAVAKRTYEAAVELFAYLCKKYGLDPLADSVIISHKEGHARGVASNHGDPEHLWNQLGMGYTMNTFRAAVKKAMSGDGSGSDSDSGSGTGKGLQATEFKDLTEAQVIAKVGSLFTADQKKRGVLASVLMAQFILESGYGKSELALNANNCFGMKKSLSGNTWSGSSWDGSSIYTKKTQEQNADGSYTTITADFRKYSCVEDSIADHSAYLLGAKNDSKLRYDGLKGCTDYKKAAQLIKDGGYATSLIYVEKLCNIIQRWNLTQYDVKVDDRESGEDASSSAKYYRVRKSWADAASQLGAYTVLVNAKAMADQHPGYVVFDWDGNAVYAAADSSKGGMMNADCPFTVKVSIADLNIRKGAGTNTAKTGQYTGIGIFTITQVKSGKGSTAGWGKLKSGVGWIALDFCSRV